LSPRYIDVVVGGQVIVTRTCGNANAFKADHADTRGARLRWLSLRPIASTPFPRAAPSHC
jgi:hypothetical protein